MGKIIKISGPLIVADGMRDVKMYDVVRVSEKGLIGEVIELRGDKASIQVYEETSMLGTGEPVTSTEQPLSVELGPGLIGGIYDGIQRPLEALAAISGDRIDRGVSAPAIDRKKKWAFVPTVKKGDKVIAGDVIGTVKENEVVEHRITVPFGIGGVIEKISSGEFTVEQVVAVVSDGKVKHERYHVATLAGAQGQTLRRKTSADRTAYHRSTRRRHAVPHSARRRGGCSRTVRVGQDGVATRACQVVGRGYYSVRRVRRARQRNDRRS